MSNRNLQDLNVYYKPSRDSVQTKQSPVTATPWGYFNLILPLHKRRYRSIQGSYVRGPHIRYESEKTYYFLKLRALQPLNTFLFKDSTAPLSPIPREASQYSPCIRTSGSPAAAAGRRSPTTVRHTYGNHTSGLSNVTSQVARLYYAEHFPRESYSPTIIVFVDRSGWRTVDLSKIFARAYFPSLSLPSFGDSGELRYLE